MGFDVMASLYSGSHCFTFASQRLFDHRHRLRERHEPRVRKFLFDGGKAEVVVRVKVRDVHGRQRFLRLRDHRGDLRPVRRA